MINKNRQKQTYERANMCEKRLMIMFIIIVVGSLSLIGRLYYIQIIRGNELSERALNQWYDVISVVDKRGKIYDRNYIPLTDRIKEDYFVIHPSIKPNNRILELLSISTTLDKDYLNNILSNMKGYQNLLIKYYDEKIIKELLSNSGIAIIELSNRYEKNGLASHLIGYINKSENIGMSGLEKFFNSELVKNRGTKIGAIIDAKKRIIPGFGYVMYEKNDDVKENIVTTIDYNIQKICEEEFDKYNYKGSIVVLDSKTGDILSMVSRPNFDQNNVGEYLDSNNMELFNKSIQISYPPGSIFKIVVAATAIENNIIDLDDKFFCKGYEVLGVNIIKCYSYEQGGHGEISFEEAFALSCNSAFIQIGQILGGEKILDMAWKFGLGQKTAIKIDKEIEGVFPSEDYVKGPGVGNISIGQGALEVTPLQVAKLTNIIANNGIDIGVRLVKEIIDDNGKILRSFARDKTTRIISPFTAQKIKEMMIKAVENGTGKRAKIENVEIAGKTGSAEAVSGSRETVHAWFTGFFEGNKSRYVITIIAEEQGSGGKIAAPIFAHIVNRLIEMGY